MSFGNEQEFIDFQQLEERKEQAKMFCPLLWIAKPEVEIGLSSEHDCLEGKCAWWDEGSSACAIWSIMSGLDALGKLFREIEKKMPHARQFTK